MEHKGLHFFTEPLNKSICDKIDIKLYNYLIMQFPKIKILDERAFTNENKFIPSISSIFVISEGGSYSDDFISYHNGTLQTYNNFDVHYYSDKYAKLMYM